MSAEPHAPPPSPPARPAPRGGRLVKLLGSFFGAGFLPMAPGTWGSLVALAAYAPMHAHFSRVRGGESEELLISLLLCAAFSAAALALGGAAERAAGRRDPRWFVLDEIAGSFLALCGLSRYNFAVAGLAFLLFRVFDVLKPGAVGWAERKMRGAAGMLLDDLLAAACANLIVRGAAFLVCGR